VTEVDILCLANSWKNKKRCVAGIRLDDGSWLRPISDREHGELSDAQCIMDNGRAVRPLDVVRVYLKEPSPRPHQPEDWTVTDRQWSFLGRKSVADARKLLEEAAEEHKDGIFGNDGDSLSHRAIRNRSIQVQSSLTLVKVNSPEFRWGTRWRQKRAVFDHASATYDLVMTFEDAPQVGGSSSEWYFTISLGEPYHGYCYKLIAGAIELSPIIVCSGLEGGR